MENVKVNTYTIRKTRMKLAVIMAAISAISWAKGTLDMNAATAESRDRKAYESNSQFTSLNTSLRSILKELCQLDNPIEVLDEMKNVKIVQDQISTAGVIMVPDIVAPEKPVIEKLVSRKTKTAMVSYEKCSGASGYEISYATNKSGTYKVAGTTASRSYTISSLTKDKTYYVRVRAYKVVNGKKVYGRYSTVKSVKVT